MKSMKKIKNNDIVVFENITKKYGKLLALNDVSFKIKKGEVFGYLGPNGAGKTTTIKIMIDLVKKTSGNIFIKEYQMPKQKDTVHRFIGYLPQQTGFQKWRTVDHALTTFGLLSGMDKNKIEKRITELLKILNLSDIRHRKISKLSGGTIQKVGFIQAVLHEPEILILDEPLSGLDPESRYQIKEIIKKMSQNGTIVFFSSHILSDVKDIATKICIIDWGQVIKIGSFDELRHEFSKENQIEIDLSKSSGKWESIKKLQGVKNIFERRGNNFIVTLNSDADSDSVIHKIILEFIKNKNQIRSIKILTPSLDEIYQYYLRKEVKVQ